MPAQIPLPPPPDQDELDLRDLLDTLVESRWLILAIVAVVFFIGVMYAWLATPIYRADALVQVEKKPAVIPGLDDLSDALTGSDAQSTAEIEIIRSRSVISPAVENLGLDIRARPRRFPLISSLVVRLSEHGQITSAWPGLRRFAWGGESVALGRLAVPSDLEGVELTLIAGKDGKFELYSDGGLLLQGTVGTAAKGGTPDAVVEIYVRELVAEAGTQFIVTKFPRDKVVTSVQKGLAVIERGRQSGILVVTLEGEKRKQVVDTINGVINSYLRQNVERRSEEASRMLVFLDQQLPELKKQLDSAETALREYKSNRSVPVDISMAGQELLSRTTDVEKQISALELQRSDLQQRYTGQHPALVSLNQQLNQLGHDRASIEKQFKGLPDTELQSIRLIRNVTVANELYIQLLNKAQELKVAKAGTIGNARILDAAILPRESVRPKKPLVLFLSLALGIFLGVAVAFTRKALRRTLDSPDRIEAQLGLPIYATIPHSRKQTSLMRTPGDRPAGAGVQLLCRDAPSDPAVESLRSLRTSMQFARLDAKNNVVAIHGPTPVLGKSFVASNLAFLLTDIGKRTLLIDADMRKGHIHDALGVNRAPGLSDLITGQGKLEETLSRFENGLLHFLSTGTLPPNPSELLVHSNFLDLILTVSRMYDFVVIDTPPTLNLADSIAIGKLAGTNFMVTRSGQSTLQDVELSNRRLQQSGIRVDGVIFNDLSASTARYRYGGYYAYKYGAQ